MTNGAVTLCSNESFISKQMFKLKVNAALKECWKIRESVKAFSKIGRDDFNINILISDIESNRIDEKYFALKGYNSDGSIRPWILYTLKDGNLLEVEAVESRKLLVVDLYESSIYVHNYTVEGNYVEGFLVKSEKTKEGYNVIFSTEKVKIFMKNANTYHEFNDVVEFLNGNIF